MKKVIIILVFISYFSITAQDYKYGKVSKEELQEKFYPTDSTADAAYLFRSRRTYFSYNQNNGFQLFTDIHERIKIYTKEGFEMATKSIPYYSPESGDSESVSGLKGYTFNLVDNKVDKEKLSSKSVFQEKLSKFRSIKKITMPNITEGSVIEIRYTIVSPYYQSIEDLQFQYHIPVKKLDYQVEIPEYFTFNKQTLGYHYVNMISESKSGSIGDLNFRVDVFKFDEENIPALKNDEPYVSNANNYRARLKFELTQTNFMSIGGELNTYSNSWETVSKQIYDTESFGGELKKSGYYKDDLEKILAIAKTDTEKIVAIFQFVKNQVKWNEYYGIYTDNGVRKAYKDRVGNVADINLILTAMLRAANLNADPVLVSTKSHGVPIFPTIDGFNYVVSAVELPNGGFVLLDATETYSSPNILPTRALNWNGRKIAKGGVSSWLKLTSSKPASEENMLIVAITDDMMMSGIYRTKFNNLSALNYRKNNNHLTEESVVTNLEEKHKIEIEEFKMLNEQQIDKAVIRNVKFISEDLIEAINGKLYIEPLLFNSLRNNPFKLDDRKFPVDFSTPWIVKNIVSIKIPEGYKVESLPENMAIGLPENMGVFKYYIEETAGKINTTCVLQFNNAVIPAQYYTILKDFYGQLVKKESEKLVLVKI